MAKQPGKEHPEEDLRKENAQPDKSSSTNGMSLRALRSLTCVPAKYNFVNGAPCNALRSLTEVA